VTTIQILMSCQNLHLPFELVVLLPSSFSGRIFMTVVGLQFFFMLNLTLGTYNGVQTTQVQTDPCCWKEARYRANATWPTLATPFQQQHGFPSPSKNYLPICNLAWVSVL
jgi:hypothetical protein